MNQLSAIGNNLNQIAARLNRSGAVDSTQLKEEIEKLKAFRPCADEKIRRAGRSTMAVTKIWPVRGRIEQPISYAMNPKKTDKNLWAGDASIEDVISYAANSEKLK